MFKKILVATDGSDHARRALAVAGNLAQRYGAELIVLHVFSCAEVNEATRHLAEVEHLAAPRRQPSYANVGVTAAIDLPGTDFDLQGFLYQAAEMVGRQTAEEGAAAARGAGAEKVTALAREGDAAEVILEVARQENADAIVLGSRGLGSLKGIMVGSVSGKVNHLSGCCCITVK